MCSPRPRLLEPTRRNEHLSCFAGRGLLLSRRFGVKDSTDCWAGTGHYQDRRRREWVQPQQSITAVASAYAIGVIANITCGESYFEKRRAFDAAWFLRRRRMEREASIRICLWSNAKLALAQSQTH